MDRVWGARMSAFAGGVRSAYVGGRESLFGALISRWLEQINKLSGCDVPFMAISIQCRTLSVDGIRERIGHCDV